MASGRSGRVRTPYLLLHRHLLGGASRLDRHGGLEWDSGGGVSACFRGLHGACGDKQYTNIDFKKRASLLS